VFTNQTIGFQRGSIFREAGGDDRGFGFRAEGKIAFVADADDFFVQPESEQNLRGGG
jgi:hypothetical protein